MFKVMNVDGIVFTVLQLPGSNYFWYEYDSDIGSDLEAMYTANTGRFSYGMAHLIEHLSFKSTLDFDSEGLIRDLSESCQYNAQTNTDYIRYHNAKHVNDWRRVVTNVVNIALNDLSRINNHEFELERQVVVSEIDRYNDDKQTMFHFNTSPMLYGRAPADNILGDSAMLSNFTLYDCQQMKRQMLQLETPKHHITYDPEVVSIDEVIEFINSEIQRVAATNTAPAICADATAYPQYMCKEMKLSPGEYVLSTEGEQNQISIVCNIGPVKSIHAVHLASMYINTVAKSNLSQKVREERGLTYSIGLSAGYQSVVDNVYVSIYTDVTPDRTEEMFNTISVSLQECVNEYTPEKYAEIMKYQRTQDVVRNLNARAAMTLHYQWDNPGIKEFLHAYEESVNIGRKASFESVTCDDVLEAVKAICTTIVNNSIIITSK